MLILLKRRHHFPEVRVEVLGTHPGAAIGKQCRHFCISQLRHPVNGQPQFFKLLLCSRDTLG